MRLNLPDRPVSPRLPQAGPIILTVPGLSDVAIGAGLESPAILFRLPGPYLLSAFWLGEETVADAATVANLRLRMQDSAGNEIFADGQGLLDNAPALALGGRSPRWQSFRRVIRAGQKWLFQIENRNAVTAIPQFYLKLEAE